MEIQQLAANTLDDLLKLVLELWPDGSFAEEYEAYSQTINSENEVCFLVKEQESYVAFSHLTIRTDYVEGASDEPVAYLEAIYVKPPYRHLGIGKKLVTVAEEWAREKGCRQLASDTELSNSASIDFHQKMGFDEVNRIVCFIKDLPSKDY